jgi:hypothetical protein
MIKRRYIQRRITELCLIRNIFQCDQCKAEWRAKVRRGHNLESWYWVCPNKCNLDDALKCAEPDEESLQKGKV